MEIVLATTNSHKVREFKDMLKLFPQLEVLTLHHFPGYEVPKETASTFQDNAIIKAEHAAKTLQKWVLADDSGLVVPSLQGQPGILSRRYAGPQATDAENRKKLLQAMQGFDMLKRAAYYECSLAISSPGGLKKCVTGICEGFISIEEKGRNGFGYDPLFVKNDYDKTFAELEEATKNRISHRRKAFERLTSFLETLKAP